ncbi:DNA methyltransferase [Kordia sp.]|uniref:DNA methyltransferase n=1 Tax=Kordia sp. TaxID=1965332 RepID=UPI003D6B96C5
MTEQEQKLKSALLNYFKTGFFFNEWFKSEQNAYYFTFKLNLSRTNIQYGEFKSLVKSNLLEGKNLLISKNDIQIHTVKMMNDSIKRIVSTFNFPIYEYRQELNKASKKLKELELNLDGILDSLVENYYEILARTIVIDTLYSSCCLFLPPNLNIDLFKIISNGGYVNTCGELVYIRNFNKADKNKFYEALSQSLDNCDEKFNFNVFSYEDFIHTKNLNHDIEHLKIHVDKFFFKRDSVSTILIEMQEKFKNKLEVNLKLNKSNIGLSNDSYWMIKDSSISPNIKIPGENNYFICYKQLYKNDNQLHIFNENKPAWKSNTSIPHTLIGAMINLALENINPKDKTVVIDPFSGTGTTVLELLKLSENYNLDIYGSDLDCLFTILLFDNAEILGMNPKKLSDLISSVSIEDSNFDKNYNLLLQNKEQLNINSVADSDEFEMDQSKVEDFSKLSLTERLHIYTYFIVRIIHTKFIERKNHLFKPRLKQELGKLNDRLNDLKETLSLPKIDSSINGFEIVKGAFSPKIIIDHNIFNKLEIKNFKEDFDFRKLESNTYDLIIGDPPYGFNTHHGMSKLLNLYRELAEFFVSAIKKNGQIILSLPDHSYSGKHSPWFTHKEMVLTRFHFESQKQNKRMVTYSEINPNKNLFNPPYYWEAQKALRRSIIHMKFI